VLGLALYMLYSMLDRFIVPQTAPQILIIRIVVSLLFLSVFAISFTKLIYRSFQLIMSLLVLAAGFGIIWMILISDAIGGSIIMQDSFWSLSTPMASAACGLFTPA